MKKLLFTVSAMFLATSASAQFMGAVPPNWDLNYSYSHDSDNFNAHNYWAGASLENGLGVRAGGSNYRADSFNADSKLLGLTYVNIGENHNFHGFFGVRDLGWSNSGVKDSKQIAVGNAEVKLTMTDSLTIGFSTSTDLVESVNGISNGTRYTYFGADADYLLTDNINLSAIIGTNRYSDNNTRLLLKTKTTYTFLPEHGVSTYFRTLHHQDSDPGSTDYFSPDKIAEYAIGVQIRKPYNGLVYWGGVDFGNRKVTDVDGNTDSFPVYNWFASIQTNPGKSVGTTYGVSLNGSNTSPSGGGGDYKWYGLNVWLKVTF